MCQHLFSQNIIDPTLQAPVSITPSRQAAQLGGYQTLQESQIQTLNTIYN